MTVDPVMHRLPPPGEDDIVLFDGILDYVGRRQHLLAILLSVCLNLTNLGRMGSPFHLCIIHLRDEC